MSFILIKKILSLICKKKDTILLYTQLYGVSELNNNSIIFYSVNKISIILLKDELINYFSLVIMIWFQITYQPCYNDMVQNYILIHNNLA